jgi:hypothetical protein
MISIPSIRSGLPFENSVSLFLNTDGNSQSGKSVNLRFFMQTSGGISITIFGVTKSMSTNTGQMTFTSSEIPNLKLTEDLYVPGQFSAGPNVSEILIQAEDESKITGLTFDPTFDGNLSFTILNDQISNNDTLDFSVELNT